MAYKESHLSLPRPANQLAPSAPADNQHRPPGKSPHFTLVDGRVRNAWSEAVQPLVSPRPVRSNLWRDRRVRFTEAELGIGCRMPKRLVSPRRRWYRICGTRQLALHSHFTVHRYVSVSPAMRRKSIRGRFGNAEPASADSSDRETCRVPRATCERGELDASHRLI